jgi:hypothetical protein
MSLFGVARPSDITFTVSGTGAAIVSSIANAIDGRPDSTSRFQWISGAQTTASVWKLRGEWTSGAFSPRLVGLSNISLPVGTKVSVAFRRSGDTVGTYPYVPTVSNQNQRVVAGPHGERTVWIHMPAGATAVVGVEITIWNDVNGAATIAASQQFNIGDIVVCPGVDVDVQAGWSLKWNDPTTVSFSWNRQPYTTPGCPYRTWAFNFTVDAQEVFWGDPANLTLIDYEELLAFLDRGQFCVYVPRYVDGAGAFSVQMLHRTAFIGIATQLPSWDHNSATWFSTRNGALITEAPIAT